MRPHIHCSNVSPRSARPVVQNLSGLRSATSRSAVALAALVLGGFVVGVLTGGVVSDVDDRGDLGDRFFDGVLNALT